VTANASMKRKVAEIGETRNMQTEEENDGSGRERESEGGKDEQRLKMSRIYLVNQQI